MYIYFMNSKRILGYIFIVIALILTLTFIVLLPKFMKVLFAMFKTDSDSYEIGYSVGYLIFLIVQTFITIFLWRVGIHWTKRS